VPVQVVFMIDVESLSCKSTDFWAFCVLLYSEHWLEWMTWQRYISSKWRLTRVRQVLAISECIYRT